MAKRIEFNVDYGLNFTAKDIEKNIKQQVGEQKELIQEYFNKGGKIPLKLNIDNAVDLNGNAIDKKSLNAFTKKYEKVINTALDTMIKEFKNNLSTEISEAVSESLSSDINKLFSNMTDMIVKGIQDMQSDIMSALSINPVTIEQSDLININNDTSEKNVFKNVTTSVVNEAKEEFQKANNELEKEALAFRLKIKELQEDIANEKKKKQEINSAIKSKQSSDNANDDFKVKIGNKNYTSEVVAQIKKDKQELEKVANDFYKKYVDKSNKFDQLNDKIDSAEEKGIDTSALTLQQKKIEQQMDNIAFVTQKLFSKPLDMENLIVNENAFEYIPDMFREVEISTNSFKDKTVEQLQEMLSESESRINIWSKNLEEAKKRIADFSKDLKTENIESEKVSIKNDKDITSNTDRIQTVIDKNGNQKIKTNIQIYPTLNQKSFLRQVNEAVQACEAALKEEPVEVPIKVDPESIGEFVGNIKDLISKYPIPIVLDKNDFKEQIRESAKDINIDINGNLTGVKVDEIQKINNSADNFDDSYDNDELWDYLEQQAKLSIPDDFVANIKAALSGVVEESEELNNEIIQATSNFDKTAVSVEKVKETLKETSDVLVGQIEVFEDPEIEILKEKIELYDNLDDLRKKRIGITKEERTLSKKEDRTDEETAKLKILQDERQQRIKIKEEWDSLSPILENINNTEKLIYDNEKKIQELQNLEGKEKLSKVEQQRLELLKKEKDEIEQNIEAEKRSLELNKQKLEIAKNNSPYFGKMHDESLLKFQKDVVGSYKVRALKTKAFDRIESIKNENVGSLEYSESYKKSYNAIINQEGKKGSLLQRELKSLVEQDKLWTSINNSIKDKGKDQALEDTNNQIEKFNLHLQKISDQKIVAEAKYKNGKYTASQYDEVKESLATQENETKAAISNEKYKANIIKKYSAEEISTIAEEKYQKRVLFQDDIKTQEGMNKRVNELRHEDLKSFKQYQYQKNEQEKRVQKQKSYEDQIDKYEKELIDSGVSKKEAKNKKYEIVKGTDYSSNNNSIKEYNRQFNNLETDLKEILSLMNQIDDLQNKLSSESISANQEKIKTDLSKKRQDLDVIVSRTGWQSSDILAYKEEQEFLKKNVKESSIIKKNANIEEFKKDASTIQDVVNNIQKELELAEQENQKLIASVEKAEKIAKQAKDNITIKYQNDAQKTLEAINNLKEEKKKLQEEIDKSNDQEEILGKQVRVGEINSQLNKLEKKNQFLSNPTKLQSAIDQEFNLRNKGFLQNIETMKSQILVNNDYINSLKTMKSEQEELRRVEEPTLEELNSRKKELTNEKTQNTKKSNQKIKDTEKDIENTKIAIQEAQKTADGAIKDIEKELSGLNKQLESAENKLKEIQSRKIDSSIKNQTNTSSDLFSEYNLKNSVFTSEQFNVKKIINSATSELDRVNRELDVMSNKYKDRINDQNYLIRNIKEQIEFEKNSIQEQINSGIAKEKIDQNNLNTLQKQLEVEQKKKNELESQYSLTFELERKQKIQTMSDLAEHIQRIQPIAKTGHIEAQNDLTNSIQKMEVLSQETGVNFGKVKTSINESGKEIKTVLLDLRDINKELNGHNINNDIEDYKQLQESKIKNEQILRDTKLPDSNIYNNVKNEYADKIYSAFIEEQRLYNKELQKTVDFTRETGELTEETENHLLNMYRYMQEYGKVAGIKKDKLFDTFNIDKDTKENIMWAWKDAQDKVLNQADSSINIEREEAAQQRIVNSLKEQIRLKDASKEKTKKEVNELQIQLSNQEKKLAQLKEEKDKKAELIALEQKENNQKIKNIKDKSSLEKSQSSISTVDSSIENKKEQLKELAQIDAQVTQEQINNEQRVQQSTKGTTEVVEETTAAIKNQNNVISANTGTNIASSAIQTQQQEAQEEIIETNQLLQQQISQAIEGAKISIAKDSYVNIAGSVKIDDGQFGSLKDNFTNVSDAAYELLDVVKQIYATISNGGSKVVKDIQSVNTPISNITTDAKEASEAIEEVQVQLSKTSKKLEVISGGDIDLGKKKFEAIKHAVDAMNEAISKNKVLKEIQKSGDITAKYYTREDEDGNVNEYVTLNSIFKDTEGKVVKLQHVYDVTARTMNEVSNVSVKMANNFEQQNKAISKSDTQLHNHLSKLDKLKIKYEAFNINNFGIDDNGNLFAKVGTNAEQTIDIITGKTKELIKNVISQMSKVENKFTELQDKASKGVLSQEEFETLSTDLSISIEKLENSMNAVNRRITTQLEHTSRSWLNTWQRELSNAEAFIWNTDGSNRLDNSNYNAQGLEYIEKYKDAVLDLRDTYEILFEQGENFTDEQVNNWKRQIQTISDLKKQINSNSAKPYVNGQGRSLDRLSLDQTQYENLINDSNYARTILSALAKEIAGTDIEVVKLSKDNQSLTYSFRDQDKNIQTCKLSVSDYGKTIRNTTVDSKEHVGLLSMAFGTLKDKLAQIFKYVSAYTIFYRVVNSIRSGVEIIRELDTAFTEMRKVSDESIQSLKNFQSISFDIAGTVGTTAKQIQNSTADWMRLGESLDEAAKSAETSNILLNVSEFESIDEATESLVAMSSAYDELDKMDIVDKLNEVGNNYAISTDGLATALQNSASALKTAGNDMDEAVALVTAGNQVVQDPNKVGSGLRTIALRITGKSNVPEHIVICGYLYKILESSYKGQNQIWG